MMNNRGLHPSQTKVSGIANLSRAVQQCNEMMCRPCLDVHILLVSCIYYYLTQKRNSGARLSSHHPGMQYIHWHCVTQLKRIIPSPILRSTTFSCHSSCAMRARSSASRPAAGLAGGGSMDASMPARPIALRNAWSRSGPQHPRPSACKTPSCAVYPGMHCKGHHGFSCVIVQVNYLGSACVPECVHRTRLVASVAQTTHAGTLAPNFVESAYTRAR